MSSKNQPSHSARRKQEFICRIKYSNSLPPQQFLPKSLIYPFPSDHLYSYKKTTLVENTPHNLLLPDQPIDLIKLGIFDLQNIEQPPKVNIKNAKVDPKDEPLLAQPVDRLTNGMAGSRARPLVPWLRRTEYIGSESTQYGRQKEDRSAAADIQPHKDRTREGQIRDIEATFEHAAAKNISTLKHPRKPHLKAVEMMPIFPELTLWPNDYCMIQFDGHPAESVPKRANSVNLSQTPQLYGILKPVQDPEDQSTVLTYYLPHEESVEILRKRQEKAEEEEDEFQDDELNYSYVREYDYAPAIDKQDSRVLFMLREGEGAFYSKIRSRVALKKRRAKSKFDPYGRKLYRNTQSSTKYPSQYQITTRQLTKSEILEKRNKISNLGVPVSEASIFAGADEIEDDLDAEVEEINRETGQASEEGGQEPSKTNGKESANVSADEDEDGEFITGEDIDAEELSVF